jgi:Kinesin motor domain
LFTVFRCDSVLSNFILIYYIAFDLQVKFNVRISCFEIYHENVFDLFAEEKDRAPLGVREHSTDGFFLVGCKLINCHSYKVACNAVGYAIQNRQVGQHDLNARSTRSHCITEIYIDLPGQAALRSTAGARAPGLRGATAASSTFLLCFCAFLYLILSFNVNGFNLLTILCSSCFYQHYVHIGCVCVSRTCYSVLYMLLCTVRATLRSLVTK